MRQKRIKSYRKVMQLYQSSFQFREPYQLLVDAAFIKSCVAQKLDFQARLEDVCQGLVKPMITQCSIQALYDLGTEGQASVDQAKDFERRKCNHFKVRPEEECLITMAGTDNKNRYVIATQSLELRKKLRTVPGLPIIYINRSVVLLEAPSGETLSKKKSMESTKLHAPASELAILSRSNLPALTSSQLIEGHLPRASTSTLLPTRTEDDDDDVEEEVVQVEKKRKIKGVKGPNPLSMKKKVKPPPTTSGNSAPLNNSRSTSSKLKKKEEVRPPKVKGKGESLEIEREKKRPRVDDVEGKVVTLSSRGAMRPVASAAVTDVGEEAGEGPIKKRKRSRGKKGNVTAPGAVVAEGVENTANDVAK